MQIVTKRIYEPASADDGYRVLVDRLWPRGVRRERAALDAWAKELAPTSALRKWFAHTPDRFAEFAGRYREELAARQDDAAQLFAAASSARRITLLYATKDERCNHAVVLREWLESLSRPE